MNHLFAQFVQYFLVNNVQAKTIAQIFSGAVGVSEHCGSLQFGEQISQFLVSVNLFAQKL